MKPAMSYNPVERFGPSRDTEPNKQGRPKKVPAKTAVLCKGDQISFHVCLVGGRRGQTHSRNHMRFYARLREICADVSRCYQHSECLRTPKNAWKILKVATCQTIQTVLQNCIISCGPWQSSIWEYSTTLANA